MTIKHYRPKPKGMTAVQFNGRNFKELRKFIGENQPYCDCKIGGLDEKDGIFKIKVYDKRGDFTFSVPHVAYVIVNSYVIKIEEKYDVIAENDMNKNYEEIV